MHQEKSVNMNIELDANEEILQLTEQLNEIHAGASIQSDGGATSAVR